MTKFIQIVLIVLCGPAMALDCKTDEATQLEKSKREELVSTPKALQGGTIVVTDVKGKAYEFSADEYMVVKRVKLVHTEKLETKVKTVCGDDKNSLLVGLRKDRTGVDVDVNGSSATAESEKGAVLDAAYVRRKIVGPVGAGAGLDTNGTPKLLLNLDF